MSNKLVPSKKRGDKQKDNNSPKKGNRKGQLGFKGPHQQPLFNEHATDMVLEGNQITYDEQNQQMSQTQLNLLDKRKSAKHSRGTSFAQQSAIAQNHQSQQVDDFPFSRF